MINEDVGAGLAGVDLRECYICSSAPRVAARQISDFTYERMLVASHVENECPSRSTTWTRIVRLP